MPRVKNKGKRIRIMKKAFKELREDELKEILRDIELIKFDYSCDCKDCQDIKNRIKEMLK